MLQSDHSAPRHPEEEKPSSYIALRAYDFCPKEWSCSEVATKGRERKGLSPTTGAACIPIMILFLKDEISSAPCTCRDASLLAGKEIIHPPRLLLQNEEIWLAELPRYWSRKQSKGWIQTLPKCLTKKKKKKKFLCFVEGQNCWINLFWSFCSATASLYSEILGRDFFFYYYYSFRKEL